MESKTDSENAAARDQISYVFSPTIELKKVNSEGEGS